VKNYTYSFEIKDLITQFVAAFDDTVIKRYDKNRNAKSNIEVRYVFGPKQRVMYDIVNKAQNITVPAVAINIKSIARDKDRVYNKLDKIYNYSTETTSTEIETPVPINIDVDMSIITRYMEDMDQIISNFIAYNNPYIILSWSEPKTNANIPTREIRTEVLWNESVSLDYPTDTTFTDKFRIIADTSFTIKGWLFKTQNIDSTPIYKITNNYRDITFTDIFSEKNILSTVVIDCIPVITDIYYNTQGNLLAITDGIVFNNSFSNNLLLYGENFEHTTQILLSSNVPVLSTEFVEISSTLTGITSGYILDENNYEIVNDNLINIRLPDIDPGAFNIIVSNDASWGSSLSATPLGFSFSN
jgi:hypothetical protein